VTAATMGSSHREAVGDLDDRHPGLDLQHDAIPLFHHAALHRSRWSVTHALLPIVYRQMVADAKRTRTGPGGHVGATLQSSAADLNPEVDTSEKSLPGPAKPQPRTPLLATT
jgi:hypothetical protein